MAEMTAAMAADNFGASYTMRIVISQPNRSLGYNIVKAWPAAARIKFGATGKQRLPASAASIPTSGLIM